MEIFEWTTPLKSKLNVENSILDVFLGMLIYDTEIIKWKTFFNSICSQIEFLQFVY